MSEKGKEKARDGDGPSWCNQDPTRNTVAGI